MKQIIFLSICILLTSCAAPIHKASTEGKDKSKLRVQMLNGGYTVEASIHEKGCKNVRRLGGIGTLDTLYKDESRNIGMLGTEEVSDAFKVEYEIEASKPTYFTFWFLGGANTPRSGGLTAYYCYGRTMFTPIKDLEYEISLKWEKDNCYTSVNTLEQDSQGSVKRTPVSSAATHKECM